MRNIFLTSFNLNISFIIFKERNKRVKFFFLSWVKIFILFLMILKFNSFLLFIYFFKKSGTSMYFFFKVGLVCNSYDILMEGSHYKNILS